MSTSLSQPHGTTLAALKGLSIATTLLGAGQLATWSANLPALYALSEKQKGPRLAAKQFAHAYHVALASMPPVEIFSTIVFGTLAWLGYRDNGKGAWKLWAGASAAMFSVIPWTIALMYTPAQKLLWVSEVADSATTLPSSGISVQVDGASPSPPGTRTPGKQGGGGGMLGVAPTGRKGAITPIEEFEPFEDAMIAPEEYEQLKVKKLLQKFNGLNYFRVVGSLTSGVLGLWAVFLEA